MEWEKWYMDAILVPFALALTLCYHVYLWHKIRTQPFSTVVGTNAHGRRLWVSDIIKNNEKKNILGVQTLRNHIMGATLMATSCILLCAGLGAVLSSTYSIKQPLNETVYGAHGEFIEAIKYATILTVFIFSFFCHALAIRFMNQVNILINSPQQDDDDDAKLTGNLSWWPEYVSELLEKGFWLNMVGNRLFYAALPLLLWIFGPVAVFLCSVAMLPILYCLDFVFETPFNGKAGCDDGNARLVSP